MGADPATSLSSVLGAIGRLANRSFVTATRLLAHLGAIWAMFQRSLHYSFIAPVGGFAKLSRQVFPMMSNVGVRSWPIVALISFLIGTVLVLQTGGVMKRYGQLQEVPGLVALSLCRELGPLMTCIILTARVGASFTAVLASMKINEELLALETMAIPPIGYLVAPRLLSMVVMVPCLTVFSFLIGMIGGAVLSWLVYDISSAAYIEKTVEYLRMTDILVGLAKALVFGVIITLVCCYYGLITEGGSMGLGRNTMVAVVTSIVVIVLADTLMTAFHVNNLLKVR